MGLAHGLSIACGGVETASLSRCGLLPCTGSKSVALHISRSGGCAAYMSSICVFPSRPSHAKKRSVEENTPETWMKFGPLQLVFANPYHTYTHVIVSTNSSMEFPTLSLSSKGEIEREMHSIHLDTSRNIATIIHIIVTAYSEGFPSRGRPYTKIK